MPHRWVLLQWGICASAILLLTLLEGWRPRNNAVQGRLDRMLFHGALFLFNGTFFSLVIAGLQLQWLQYTELNRLGLLPSLGFFGPLEIVVAVVLLDMTGYWIHRLHHHSSFLWRFHQVHHSDTEMDLTTGFRSHIGQSVSSAVLEGIGILLIGPSPLAFVVYSTLLFLAVHFHHSNLSLPERLEKKLSAFLVVPATHVAHHERDRSFYNSNFSALFTFWDRLFGTQTPLRTSSAQLLGNGDSPPLSLKAVLFSPFERILSYSLLMIISVGFTTPVWAGSCSAAVMFEPTLLERILGYRWPILLLVTSIVVMAIVARKNRANHQ